VNAPADLPLAVAPAFEPGVFYGMPGAEYYRVRALSASGAKKILKSPLHYLFNIMNPSEPSAVMQFGTVVHCGVLEPDCFGERVALAPPLDKRTKEGKLLWADFGATNAGKIIMSPDDYERARACIAAVRAHPGAAKLLDGGERELSLFWRDAKHNVPCKCRDDIYSHGGVTDLKTCQDASPEGFGRQIANMGYHIAASHYWSGHEHAMGESPRFFAFIAVEYDPPHAVACYALPSNAILAGAHLMNKALERYAEALAAGEFKGYPDTIETIELPRWATSFPA